MAVLDVIKYINDRKDKKKQGPYEALTKEIQELKSEVNEIRMKDLRNRLINEYTDMIHGAKKTKEQLQDIEDDYQEYTQRGGNSYVHDLHDIWLEQKKGGK